MQGVALEKLIEICKTTNDPRHKIRHGNILTLRF